MANYQKYTASKIFTGTELCEGLTLIVQPNGRVEDLVFTTEAGDDIQHLPGLLLPGLVNAHCHLELSHMKGRIAPQGGMTDFLLQVMQTREAGETEKQEAIEAAEAEMQRNGIVAVGDICNTADTLFQKTKQQLRYFNFIEVSGFVPFGAPKRYAAALELCNRFKALFSESAIAPHAPYSVSSFLMEMIFAEPPLRTSLHNQESEDEQLFFQQKSGPLLRLYEGLGIDISFFEPPGKSPLQWALPFLKKDTPLILAHNCFTGKEDLAALESQQMDNLFFCLCPNANRYIGNPLPNVQLLAESPYPVCLGTDSLASNTELNLWSEIQTLQQQFPQLPLATLLQWATLNGARALGMDKELGSFEKGKIPGLVTVAEGKITRIL